MPDPMNDQMTEHSPFGPRIRLFLFLAAVFFFSIHCAVVAASSLPQTPSKPAPAQWITCPGAPAKDLAMLHFRKELDLERVPDHFFVDVSADNRFLLKINQQRVGAGPARGDLSHWRYEVFDLAPFLHVGKNVLAATVWNLGTFAPVAQISYRTGFLVRGESQLEQIANTNDSWWAEQEPGFQVAAVSMGELRGYFAADPIEKIDGASMIGPGTLCHPPPLAGKKRSPWALAPIASLGTRRTTGSWCAISCLRWNGERCPEDES